MLDYKDWSGISAISTGFNEITDYKVGDKLYGSNGFYITITKVNSDQSINFKMTFPRSGTYKWYAEGYHKKGQWATVPNNNFEIKNWSKNTWIQMKVEYSTTKRCSKSISWWGNKYGNSIIYGNPPYGNYDIHKDVNDKAPEKTHSAEYWRKYFGLDSGWRMVSGSYRWERSGNFAYWGWRKETNYGPYRNQYAKRFIIDFEKKTSSDKGTKAITINKIKSTKVYPDPFYFFANEIKPVNRMLFAPAENNYELSSPYIQAEPGGVILNRNFRLLWSSDSEVMDNYYSYTVVEAKLTKQGTTTQIDIAREITEQQPLTEIGDYYVKIRGQVRADQGNAAGIVTIEEVKFTLVDLTPATPAIIYNGTDKQDRYDMSKKIYNKDRNPAWDELQGHSYNAVYDYYSFENEGYDVKQVSSCLEFSNGTTLSKDGQYELRVDSIYNRNGKSARTECLFIIDKRRPNPPTIVVNGDSYIGAWNDKVPTQYVDIAKIEILLPPYCTGQVDIYWKRYNRDSWAKQELSQENMFETGTIKMEKDSYFTKQSGTYKIVARAYKTTNDTVSEDSVAIFKVKQKRTFDITLSPNTLCYRTVATINFPPTEPGLRKYYAINDGEWKYYLEPIFIYENCTIRCMAADEDGFESYITTKEVNIIDKSFPRAPEITNVKEGDYKDPFTPTIK